MMSVVYELCVDTPKSVGACLGFARFQFVSLNLDWDPERWTPVQMVLGKNIFICISAESFRKHPVLVLVLLAVN